MKLKEVFKEMQEAQIRKLAGLEILGFKTRIYTQVTRQYRYKSLYAYKCENGKKIQIFLGKSESVEEIETKIKKYLAKHENDDRPI